MVNDYPEKITGMRAILEEKRSIENFPVRVLRFAPCPRELSLPRILRLDFTRCRGLRCLSCCMPKWWNWQTRHLEGVVGKPVRVQIPPSAPAFTPHCKASQGYRSYGWQAIGEGQRCRYRGEIASLHHHQRRSRMAQPITYCAFAMRDCTEDFDRLFRKTHCRNTTGT